MIRAALKTAAFLLATATFASAEANWELIKQTADTKIYTRENPKDRIKELKVVTRMDATVDELLSVYLDGNNHFRWYPACLTSKVVRKVNDSDVQVYHHIDNPWPVQDRDYVIELKATRDASTGGALVNYKQVPTATPMGKDCVRMRKIEGYWKFDPGSDGKTIVSYVLNFDPGGNTPASLINMSLSNIGTTTFDAMSKYANSRRTSPNR